METLAFPPTPALAMVDFALATALGNALVKKGFLTPAELRNLYHDVANSLSNSPEMNVARTLLRQIAPS